MAREHWKFRGWYRCWRTPLLAPLGPMRYPGLVARAWTSPMLVLRAKSDDGHVGLPTEEICSAWRCLRRAAEESRNPRPGLITLHFQLLETAWRSSMFST